MSVGNPFSFRRFQWASLVSFIFLFLAPPPTFGEEPKTTGLEEIVVTAQKREEILQEVPISITAFSESAIEKRGIINTEDLMNSLAGVNGFNAPGSKGAVGLNIRGVAGGSPANLSLDPAAALYIDGIYLGKIVGSGMDVAEIQRIEVLRGPQGTLYGRNSTAGAVNIITRKPTGEFGARTTASYGNYNYWALKANVDLPAVGEVGEGLGRLATSFGFQTRNRNDLYINNSWGQHDFDNMDRYAWRAAATWTPSDTFQADYTFDQSKLKENMTLQRIVGFTSLDAAGNIDRISAMQGVLQGAQYWATLPGADPRIASRWIPSLEKTISDYQRALDRGEGRKRSGNSDHAPWTRNNTEGHALTLTWDAGNAGLLGDVTLKSITGYRTLDSYVYGDLEDIDSRLDANGVGSYSDLVHLTLGQLYGGSGGYAYPLVDSLWDGIDSIGAYHSKQNTTTKYRQFSQELQFVGTTEQVEYVLGLYYFQDGGRYRRNAIFAAPLNGAGSQYYNNDTDAKAVFGQATWTPRVLEDRFSITGGIRYTEETKGIDYNYSEVVTPFGVTPAMALSDSKDFSNTSFSVTPAMQWTPDLNTYLRYATGYRSGGFNGEVFDNPYKEETIAEWEVGMKSDWWDNRLRINPSLYYYNYNDMQVSQIKTTGGAATSLITNAGKAKRWGGELELVVVPIEDLIVSASYAYVHGDFDKFPDVCGTNLPVTCLNSSHYAKRTSPENQITVALDYVFARTSIGDFTGFAQANWQDEWAESALWSGVVGGDPVIYPHQMMDARTLVDARLSLEHIPLGDGNMRVSLWGKNLLDEDYPTFSINFGSLGPITEQYGEPRTYGLEVAYEF